MAEPAAGATPSHPVRHGLPRPIEVVLAGCGLMVSLPVVAIAAALVRATSRGPALFRQERVGLAGRSFTLFKLRTMRHSDSGPQVTVRGDARITPIGRVLRRSKLDELPQLWNVVRGDMSLVGPRPEVPRYVDLMDPVWKRVLSARPGITDPVTLRLRDEEALLAGVEGDPERFYRERLLPEKLQQYLRYLEARTAWTDVEVLYRTVLAIVFPRRGGSSGELPAGRGSSPSKPG